MLCRYFNFGLDFVLDQTMRAFTIMMDEMQRINRMEMGTENEPASVTGETGFNVAKRIFPKRK